MQHARPIDPTGRPDAQTNPSRRRHKAIAAAFAPPLGLAILGAVMAAHETADFLFVFEEVVLFTCHSALGPVGVLFYPGGPIPPAAIFPAMVLGALVIWSAYLWALLLTQFGTAPWGVHLALSTVWCGLSVLVGVLPLWIGT